MRFVISIATLIGAVAVAAPASAVTKQQAPVPSGGQQVRIADPDEQHEELANRTERAAKRRAYDRTSARSIMAIGSAPRSGH